MGIVRILRNVKGVQEFCYKIIIHVFGIKLVTGGVDDSKIDEFSVLRNIRMSPKEKGIHKNFSYVAYVPYAMRYSSHIALTQNTCSVESKHFNLINMIKTQRMIADK